MEKMLAEDDPIALLEMLLGHLPPVGHDDQPSTWVMRGIQKRFNPEFIVDEQKKTRLQQLFLKLVVMLSEPLQPGSALVRLLEEFQVTTGDLQDLMREMQNLLGLFWPMAIELHETLGLAAQRDKPLEDFVISDDVRNHVETLMNKPGLPST